MASNYNILTGLANSVSPTAIPSSGIVGSTATGVANALTSTYTPTIDDSTVGSADSLTSAYSAMVQDDRTWAEEQAQIARDYQTEMSNTAYQRAVDDMVAAGLNPMLAYSQGSASTPVGSTATTSSTSTSAEISSDQITASYDIAVLQAITSVLNGITSSVTSLATG